MKERGERRDPTLEILIDEALSRFYTTETMPRSSEPYNIYQAAEDVIKKYELDPTSLFLTLIRDTSLIPYEVTQIADIDDNLTWTNLLLSWSVTIVGLEAQRRFPSLDEDTKDKFERHGE